MSSPESFAAKYPAYLTPATAAGLIEKSREQCAQLAQRRAERKAAEVYEQMLRDVRAQGVLQRAHQQAQAGRFV